MRDYDEFFHVRTVQPETLKFRYVLTFLCNLALISTQPQKGSLRHGLHLA